MKMNEQLAKEVIDFVNTTTTEQQMYLLQCISERISISIEKDKYVDSFTIEDPFSNIFLNGIFIEILIDDKEKK